MSFEGCALFTTWKLLGWVTEKQKESVFYAVLHQLEADSTILTQHSTKTRVSTVQKSRDSLPRLLLKLSTTCLMLNNQQLPISTVHACVYTKTLFPCCWCIQIHTYVRTYIRIRYLTQVTYVIMRNCRVDFPQNSTQYNGDFQ